MEERELKVYRTLQEHLDKQPIGYPATESGIELKVLKHVFTIEEAEIASNMNFIPEKIKNIYRRLKNTGSTIDELRAMLDKMYEKGTILRVEHEGNTYYANMPYVIGIYENQLGRLTKDFYLDSENYMEEFFDKSYNKTAVPQLRVIPIEESITHEQSIASYDELRNIIEGSEGKIVLMECICKQGQDLIGDPCKKTDMREVCFAFRRAAEEAHQRGFGRYISKEEALSVLKKIEEAGLVLQPDNSQRPQYMCSCCGCCCGVLKTQKKYSQPAKFFATNFHAEVDADLCIACATCVERCNLDAITVDDIAIIDLDRCIGCGACVITCTEEAITLKQNEEKITPPTNTGQKMKIIMDEKAKQERMQKT